MENGERSWHLIKVTQCQQVSLESCQVRSPCIAPSLVYACVFAELVSYTTSLADVHLCLHSEYYAHLILKTMCVFLNAYTYMYMLIIHNKMRHGCNTLYTI